VFELVVAHVVATTCALQQAKAVDDAKAKFVEAAKVLVRS
jgi:hypothetical protein